MIALVGTDAGSGVIALNLVTGSNGSTIRGLDIDNFSGSGSAGIGITSSGNSIEGCVPGYRSDGRVHGRLLIELRCRRRGQLQHDRRDGRRPGQLDLERRYRHLDLGGIGQPGRGQQDRQRPHRHRRGAQRVRRRRRRRGHGQHGRRRGRGAGNLITDSYDDNLLVDGSDNLAEGNKIGTDISGTVSLSSDVAAGLVVDGSANTIGGTAAGAGNLISGGLGITGSDNLAEGNLIGTNAAGTAALANGPTDATGVAISDGGTGNTIGGTTALDRNIISGNGERAVTILNGANANLIEGNYIGTDVTGTVGLGNGIPGLTGVLVGTAGNTIGGTVAGAGNVICDSGDYGVRLSGSAAIDNLVAGDYIGTNAAGTAAIPNANDGVAIDSGASNNTIGGTTPAAINVISGNATDGVVITGAGTSANVVEGNEIGTNTTGTAAIGNADDGVEIESGASGNIIGGTATGAGNVISGNTQDGVEITGSGTTGNVVAGNLIGTNAAGNRRDWQRLSDGVEIDTGASGNTIGGTTSAVRNVIAGSGLAGVETYGAAAGNVIAGNYIGTDVTGTVSLGNSVGIWIATAQNTIGGTAAGAGNIIAGNDGTGNYYYGIQLNITGFNTTDHPIDNVVEGNQIGLDANGQPIAGATNVGVYLGGDSTGNTIGGTTAATRNVISGNTGGVYLVGAASDVVIGNYIGTDPTGSSAIGNGALGTGVIIYQGAFDDTIGGTVSGAGNVVSGNYYGITIGPGGDETGNVVEGNYIGTDETGTVAVPNTLNGINLYDSGGANTIGGPTSTPGTGAGNLIAGNGAYGVAIAGEAADMVLGNVIGSVALPGGGTSPANQDGIFVGQSNGIQIGSPSPLDTNVISGNSVNGIDISDSASTLVQGNLIGTNLAGTAADPNGGDGVYVYAGSTGTTIGGTAAGAGNVISGNTTNGVEISGSGATGNVVAGNLIGTDVTGLLALANGGDGVEIDTGASGNLIGGSTAAARNILSANFDSGVEINDANDNLVEGNYAGTDITGTVALANNPTSTLAGGVTVNNGAAGNTIGGLTATPGTGAGNVLSGNIFAGVLFYYAGSNNLVVGNLIGTDPSGTVALGNYDPNFIYGGFGVCLQFSADNIIGEPGGRNVISANGPLVSNSANVSLYYSSGTIVQSNYIGTDITGTVALSQFTYTGIATQFGSYTIGGLTFNARHGTGQCHFGQRIRRRMRRRWWALLDLHRREHRRRRSER